MKELTIEQKAYNEALERARQLLRTSVAFDRFTIEKIFPELKESEDEKIRKAILELVRQSSEVLDKQNQNNMITWLKKQGEQNYKIIKGKNYFCIKTHNYAGVEWIKGTKYYASDNYTLVNQGCEYYCPEYSKEEHNNLFEEVKYDGCVEKQGNIVEAFRTNTSIEDDVRRRSTIQVLEYARSLDTYNQYGKADIDKNISWLEKQGEQSIKWNKNTKGNKPQVNHSVLMKTSHGIVEGEWNGDDSWIQYRWASSVKDSDVLFWIKLSDLEEQVEQKPVDSYCQENCRGFQETGKCFADGDCKAKREAESVDKFEPKFHEGDWIVQGYNILKIKCVGNTHYCFETVGGYVDDMLISEIDSQFHLWTIQDAKDGDVLAFYCEYNGNKMVQVGIIEKYVGKHGGCSNTFKIYVGVDWENNLKIGEYMGCPDIRPATKEQRDKLFEKMHEAEYDWDTEKKELKKIEESENIKNQIMSEITDLVKDYITQKPAKWSEEDELSCFESALFTAFSDAWQSYLLGENVNVKQWAKEHSKELLEAAKEELKGHNPAWSEEDEQIILSIEQVMNCASLLNIVPEKMDKIRTWLKSLKNRVY